MAKTSDPTVASIRSSDADFDAAAFEQSNVHSVYQAIAPHFSDTRYKPWPLIPAFVASLPSGALGADLGCGNGKYLALRSIVKVRSALESTAAANSNDILTLGLDRSHNLVDVAQTNFGSAGQAESSQGQRNEVAVGDALNSGFRSRCFDFAISIATIHHFATKERRIQAVQELIRIVRPAAEASKAKSHDAMHQANGLEAYPDLGYGTARFLIVVWALEQRGTTRRRFEQVAEQSKEDRAQDLLVPWILKGRRLANAASDVKSNEKDEETPVFQRFYHVFKQGELELLVDEASKHFSDLTIRHETGGWEKGNWYGIWRCIRR